jgi:[citrate (pro-3S)-lyase] ligase
VIQDCYSEYATFTSGGLEWAIDSFSDNPQLQPELADFLKSCDLELDGNIADFVTVRAQGQLVACAGMGENVIKCVAVSETLRGQNITLRLISDVMHLAADMGRYQLFLYTKPENVETFASCGFLPAGGNARCHCADGKLASGPAALLQRSGCPASEWLKIGSIVMNANPFTYGHQYLAEHGGCSM